jgi:hypothetical protein
VRSRPNKSAGTLLVAETRGNVYLAYAPDDAPEMEFVAALLRDDLWDVSLGPIVEVGPVFTANIARRLDQASCVVVAWSANSVQSRRIVREAAHASTFKKLVAVRLDHAALPQTEAPTIDFSDWEGPLHPTLVGDLLSLVEATAVRLNPLHAPKRSRPTGHLGLRVLLAASGLVAAALYGWSVWLLWR